MLKRLILFLRFLKEIIKIISPNLGIDKEINYFKIGRDNIKILKGII